MTSIFLYGTVYDIHVFIHHHKWQFISSMFFYWDQPGSFKYLELLYIPKESKTLFQEDYDAYFTKNHNALFAALDPKNPKKSDWVCCNDKGRWKWPYLFTAQMRICHTARGSGLANKLIEKAEDFARGIGAQGYILKTVDVQYAAIKVYKRHGCFVEKVETAFINPGLLPGFKMLMLMMRKNF